MLGIPFNNQYVSLGEAFYSRVMPTPVAQPTLIRWNDSLAAELGISTTAPDEAGLAAVFAGNVVPVGAEPLAMAYAGHQFGQFVPQLGDGRAILLGEVGDAASGRVALQLKGAGRTVYSRNGDGRAALGPVLREYLLSEAMHRLGVPTTRALAAVATGESVVRERLFPGAIITRVASSLVRVGTFEYFAACGDVPSLRRLADYVIACNYPLLQQTGNPYRALLDAIVQGQAALIARWMQLGFIHGVMNTDNMSVACETIDYGPCAFMDAFDPQQTFSYIDRQGRYAYDQQPLIALWNLTRLAETLLPLFVDDGDQAVQQASDILETFRPHYEQAWLDGMRAKCGLLPNAGHEQGDRALIEDLLGMMASREADFTLTFYYLSRLHVAHDRSQSGEHAAQEQYCRQLFGDSGAFAEWLTRWRGRLALDARNDAKRQAAMQAVNPVYIPRNHQIEAAIRAAEDRQDFSVFHALFDVLQDPYTEQQRGEHYKQPPAPHEVVQYTFCGT